MSQDFYGVVYVVTNTVNGKRYVGQTTAADPDAYWGKHLGGARNGRRKLLYDAIRKHGEAEFDFEVIWYASDKASLDISEDSFICLFQTIAPAGYNLKGGGSHGKYSDITKKKISENTRIACAREDVKLNRRLAEAPEIKLRRGAAISKAIAAPAVKARQRTSAKIAGARPEVKLKRSIAATIAQNRPETLAAQREATRRPEVHDRRSAAAVEVNARPEIRNRKIALAAQPGVKEKHSVIAKSAAARPDVQIKLSKRNAGKRWITDGKRSRLLRPSDGPLPQGWFYGRPPCR